MPPRASSATIFRFIFVAAAELVSISGSSYPFPSSSARRWSISPEANCNRMYDNKCRRNHIAISLKGDPSCFSSYTEFIQPASVALLSPTLVVCPRIICSRDSKLLFWGEGCTYMGPFTALAMHFPSMDKPGTMHMQLDLFGILSV